MCSKFSNVCLKMYSYIASFISTATFGLDDENARTAKLLKMNLMTIFNSNIFM